MSRAMGLLCLISLSSAFHYPLSSKSNLNLGGTFRIADLSTRTCPQVSRISCLLDAADTPRRKKEMPQYVQEILTKESLVENPYNATQLVEGMLKSQTASKRRKQNVVNTEVYIRGLPWTMDRKALRTLFSNYSSLYARISTLPTNSSRSLGYGFVGFKTVSKANAAIRAFNGTEIQHEGKKTTIYVTFAAAKPKGRELASKSSQREFKEMISERKAQLAARDTGKVVMSADDMPRRWKIMSDKVRCHSRTPESAPCELPCGLSVSIRRRCACMPILQEMIRKDGYHNIDRIGCYALTCPCHTRRRRHSRRSPSPPPLTTRRRRAATTRTRGRGAPSTTSCKLAMRSRSAAAAVPMSHAAPDRTDAPPPAQKCRPHRE
jgi:hypothetical protein